MATREEILARARQIIIADPTSGKARINKILQIEYGAGLRSETVLRLKREIVAEQPRLAAQLYGLGGVPRGLTEVYNGWRKAGFLPFEARELTVGHGERYRNFDARAVYDSEPGRLARQHRREMIQNQLKAGWTPERIKANIIDFYMRSREVDVWQHIRAEYKPTKKVADFIDYRDKVRKRALARQKRMMRI